MFFLDLNLFYSLQRALNGFITEKGGIQMLFYIETHITCDFPGGGGGSGPPIPPPLDPNLSTEHGIYPAAKC